MTPHSPTLFLVSGEVLLALQKFLLCATTLGHVWSGVNPSSSLPFLPLPPNDGRIWCGFSPPFVSCPCCRFLRPENGRWKKRGSIRHTSRPTDLLPLLRPLHRSLLRSFPQLSLSSIRSFPLRHFFTSHLPFIVAPPSPPREKALFLSDQSRMTRILELSGDGRSVGCG